MAAKGDTFPVADSVHIPVLAAEVLQLGAAAAGQRWVDGTAGGGGHSRLIADVLGPNGGLLAIDRDVGVVDRLTGNLPANCLVRHSSYDEIPETLSEIGWDTVDGILLDLGLSSDQLADRGLRLQLHCRRSARYAF